MKKYLFGIFAVVIAFTGFAFKEAQSSKRESLYVFQFNNANPYTTANVQNISNTYWQFLGMDMGYCLGDGKACRVMVTAAYVDNPINPTELTGVTISATMSGGAAYVSGISGFGSQFSNEAK